ncbi:mixed lineage kinase domain-like protein [Seriola aureovittata]|uniref:mixed lineage kinase domain-like protein n=1 Tax=Seriola aureovittata TaxID=2871759 RepID=UPI0024BEBDB6|nr:mixed lineage kinase domain-like protein [Seriola aureovittata]XP_056243906.1 mixed lineage kinase domain-like protein [Seriola aureovittata]
MDYVEPILTIVSEIYTLIQNVKANKKSCRRVFGRVQSLEQLVKSIQQRGTVQVSDDVEKALKELNGVLKSAQTIIDKYASSNWVKLILKSSSHKEEFIIVNERLNETFQLLSGALQLEQGNALYMVYVEVSKKKDDEDAGTEDDAELKDLLLENMREQQEKLDAIKSDVEKLIEIMNTPRKAEDNQMIRQSDLQYERKPFMKTATSEVYKGKYHGFEVAIKRYTEPVNKSPREIRAFFEREVKTMKQFQSPNILRMYGISVRDEDGPNPQFLVVTEYCELGSLRQVLDSSVELSWAKKAQMCLDAALGLYQLHHTGEKSRIHGCITSSKFLVAENYRVKLGGFELAKTETSLKRSKTVESRSSCYESPQKLNDINYEYSDKCEIYSFGIVLWEIVTRKIPFQFCSIEQIEQKVCKERSCEPFPDDCVDCPEALRRLIDDCREYDGFHRPTAGVLVDELQVLVAQLKKQ